MNKINKPLARLRLKKNLQMLGRYIICNPQKTSMQILFLFYLRQRGSWEIVTCARLHSYVNKGFNSGVSDIKAIFVPILRAASGSKYLLTEV